MTDEALIRQARQSALPYEDAGYNTTARLLRQLADRLEQLSRQGALGLGEIPRLVEALRGEVMAVQVGAVPGVTVDPPDDPKIEALERRLKRLEDSLRRMAGLDDGRRDQEEPLS